MQYAENETVTVTGDAKPPIAPADQPKLAELSIAEELQARKNEAGREVVELPKCGLFASFPSFISHDQVLNARKVAGKKSDRTVKILIAQNCLFGRTKDRQEERLTIDQIGSLLPNADVTHLSTKLLIEDEEGN